MKNLWDDFHWKIARCFRDRMINVPMQRPFSPISYQRDFFYQLYLAEVSEAFLFATHLPVRGERIKIFHNFPRVFIE